MPMPFVFPLLWTPQGATHLYNTLSGLYNDEELHELLGWLKAQAAGSIVGAFRACGGSLLSVKAHVVRRLSIFSSMPTPTIISSSTRAAAVVSLAEVRVSAEGVIRQQPPEDLELGSRAPGAVEQRPEQAQEATEPRL